MENAPDVPRSNRRREPRTPHRAIAVMIYGHAQEEKAILVDCSPGGVMLLVNREVIPNASVMLKLGHTADSPIAAYEVRHCQQVPEGFLLGSQFLGFIGDSNATLDGQAAFEKLLLL